MMLAAQFWVTNERGTYLCTARALVFEGSILAYNPALNEAEWIPVRGLANDLSWGEKRSTVDLANYVLCAHKEGKRIAGLGVSRVVSFLDDDISTTSMEEEEELWFSDTPSTGPWMDMDCEADVESEGPEGSKDMSGWNSPQEDGEDSPHIDQCQCSRNWESIMEGSEGLALALILLSQGQTAHQCPHSLHMMTQEIPHPPGQGILPLAHRGWPWRQGVCHH